MKSVSATLTRLGSIIIGTIGISAASVASAAPLDPTDYDMVTQPVIDDLFAAGLQTTTGGSWLICACFYRFEGPSALPIFISDPSPLQPVPEPAALGLLGVGALGVAIRRRRR